jgi:hypothetical protein
MKKNHTSVLFLSTEDYLSREQRGLVEAFSGQAKVLSLDRFYDDWQSITSSFEGRRPDLVFHPDVHRTYLPEGIEHANIPTACLHIDTYSATKSRVRMSLLFDISFVCHPGYPEYFEAEGHPESRLLPHAVRASLYDKPLPEKTLDVAMVGRMHGSHYSYRRSCAQSIQELDVATNDFGKYYEYEEMVEVYRRAEIGLNVSRDNHLQDANLRCFEVMGGGALLMTPLPTELSDLGMSEGEHFIGYESEEDLTEKVQYYLANDKERREIAAGGREVTLNRFTYDQWAKQILHRIKEGIPPQAPAREMSKGEVASIYVDYFSKRGKIGETLRHLRHQREAGSLESSFLRSLGKAAKVTFRGWQHALLS